MPRARKKTILVASNGPALTSKRKRGLEHAGYRLVLAKTADQLTRACEKQHIDLVLLVSSLTPAEKRHLWAGSHNICKTPVLELFSSGPPELMDESRVFVHQSRTASDFLNIVEQILK